MEKLKVGILGATGMVGQRFVTLLDNHPWFDVTLLAASPRSAGQKYDDCVKVRWAMTQPIPQYAKNMVVKDASDVKNIAKEVDFVFCAVDMKKDEIKTLEEAYAKAECPVISNNSAFRYTADVPMIIPELNHNHTDIIEAQRSRLGTKLGFIAVKSNCSIQSYVPALFPLQEFGLEQVCVSTYQAISGAGKTFDSWPEIIDNVIPFIPGEDEKSEIEPLKIFGTIKNGAIKDAVKPIFTAQCIRVPVSDGHLATVYVKFTNKPSKEQILSKWKNFDNPIAKYNLPSTPKKFLNYFTEDNAPQTKQHRDLENGMGISMGRLREDNIFDYKFVCLSHNTLRGAAGGGVLMAELLYAKGYFKN